MKKIAIFVLFLLLLITFFTALSTSLQSQEATKIGDIKELEDRLVNAQGKERIEILVQVIEYHLKTNPRKVVDYGKEALQLLERFKDTEKELGVLDQLSQACFYTGDYENALAYAEKALTIAEKMTDRTKQAKDLNLISMIYIRKGDFDKGREYSLKAYQIFLEAANKQWMAISLNNIGISYDMQGNYEKSLEYYLKSLEIKEELGDKVLIASSLNNIGVVYKSLNKNSQALECYMKSLKLREELHDLKGTSNLYNNIGNVYWDMKDTNKTKEFYLKSLAIDRELNNQSGISSTLFNLGLLDFEANKFNSALEYYRQALAIREKMGEKTSVAQTQIEIGRVYQKAKRYHEAIQITNQGMATAKESGDLEMLKEGNQNLSGIYEEMSDYRLALQYYKEFQKTSEKIISTESNNKIAEMQSKYEADKKEKEILLLKKDNEIQKYMLSRQKLIRNLMIAGFILLLIIVVQLIRKYRYIFVFWKKKNYIGHYKILEQIATGGMGTIYKAADITDSHKHPIAIKVMREEFFADEIQLKRFKQEASIVDQLVHPNIVKIIERGETDGGLYIAMELLQGPTLAQIIQEEDKISIPIALNIMVQIADVLKSIHSMKIIHRDLKPENIVLIQKDNNPYFVKLLDFGLATTQNMTRLTETGMVVGTIFYLSPEQVSGGQVTLASDVHALGIIFYEMLTGIRPFIGETTIDVMKQIIDIEPIHPDKFRPEIDKTLCDLVMFMLRKDPVHRPTAEATYNILKELWRSEIRD